MSLKIPAKLNTRDFNDTQVLEPVEERCRKDKSKQRLRERIDTSFIIIILPGYRELQKPYSR